MTPAARLQTAIVILDDVLESVRSQGLPADRLMAHALATRRYAGSKDRAAIRELVFAVLRFMPGPLPSGRIAAWAYGQQHDPGLCDLFGAADRYGPAPITAEEAQHAALTHHPQQEWIEALVKTLPVADQSGLLHALSQRASLDLRINLLRCTPDEARAALAAFGVQDLPPWGLRISEAVDITRHSAYRQGWVDVQDYGSQLVALASGVRPGDRVADLCAGSGGKALALAAMMGNTGDIVASDISAARLARLAPRAQRLGVTCISACAPDALEGVFDGVVVDAPCSGSGTWRRNPDLRLRMSAQMVDERCAMQAQLLDRAVSLLRPGGRLVYAVCSWIPAEGPDAITALCQREPRVRVVAVERWGAPFERLRQGASPEGGEGGERPGLLLVPQRHECDGFFIACLEKLC